MLGPVAAYNWLVLLSFPLSAAAAYLLARHLTLSPAGAAVAAMAYAFSPFHLAHAAYHPHIAQTQWVPLYLLALWRCLDNASPAAVGLSRRRGDRRDALELLRRLDRGGHHAGGGGGVLARPIEPADRRCRIDAPAGRHRRRVSCSSPPAGMAYACVRRRRRRREPRGLRVPSRRSVPLQREMVELSGSAGRASAARRGRAALLDRRAGVREGLLEQQVSLGWGIVALGLVASSWLAELARKRREAAAQPASPARVPVLVIVAVAALVCSLSPERTIGAFTFVRPSALLYTSCRCSGPTRDSASSCSSWRRCWRASAWTISAGPAPGARGACVALVALAAGEYAVLAVGAVARCAADDGAPMGDAAAGGVRVLDCTPLDQESHRFSG